MVTIREDTHNKLGGVNSLFVSFDKVPSQDILNILKVCDVYNYDVKTHEWEFLVNKFEYLIENLVYFDDINVFLKEDNKNTQVETKSSKIKRKSTLFKHQEEAVEFGKLNKKWLLLDAPGLGKSLSVIALAEELKEQSLLEHCLIICGINTLKQNWKKEIKKHSNLSCIIIGEQINSKGKVTYSSITKRAEQLKNKIDEFFIIINIESLRDDKIIDAINNGENKIDMMCLDEAHKCKGVSTIQGKNLLSTSSEYMIAMTGTLLMNNPLDSYIPLAWIGKEKKNNVTNFKKTYCVYDPLTKGRIIGFKNLDILKDELESCSLRRTKDLLDLPPKNIIKEYIEMEDSHRKFYDNIKLGIKKECDKVNLLPNNVLSLVTRLRQATSCPSMLTSSNIVSSKIERCIDLVDEITSCGDKVVIFSNFKEPLYQLNDLLKQYNPLIGTGDMKDEDVSNNIDLFQNNDINKVFLATTQKMGTGVTLTKANYMIFLDSCWTSALQEQCEDRIHRIGSTKPVFIYRLICNNTIDEKVDDILERKEALSEFIIDNKQDNKIIDILKNYILDM